MIYNMRRFICPEVRKILRERAPIGVAGFKATPEMLGYVYDRIAADYKAGKWRGYEVRLSRHSRPASWHFMYFAFEVSYAAGEDPDFSGENWGSMPKKTAISHALAALCAYEKSPPATAV